MKSRTWKNFWSAAVLALAAAQATADDVLPPCWRARPDTTLQHWRFDANANPAVPEIVSNPHGAPTLSVQLGQAAAGWINDLFLFGTNQGIWDLGRGGVMTATVPNQAKPAGSWKLVSVQVYQYLDGIYSQPAVVSIPGATRVGGQMRTNAATLFGNWVADQSVWRIEPCPASETIVVTGGTNGAPSSAIDQVVVDTICLSVTCPTDQTLNADPGQCSRANVTWSLPAADGCVLTNVTCTPASGSTFPVGTTPVSCTVRDAYGHTVNCSFTITVADAEPPAANCPADITVAGDPALCGEVVTFTATASDNCPGATITCTPPSGSFFSVGMTTVTCTAQDAAGLTSSCMFQVTVTSAPSLPGDAFPACWRGRPGTTFQDWAFNAPANPTTPEQANNPHGQPWATNTPGAFSAGWQDQIPGLGCRQGIWDLGMSGEQFLEIPNSAMPAPAYKYLRIQITQWQDGGLYSQLAAVSFPNIPGATLINQPAPAVVETIPGVGRWVVDLQVWRLEPCPATELIQITGAALGSLIDEVIVDTLCFQPPACPTDITGDADPGQCVKSGITWALPAADGCLIRSVVCETNGTAVTQPASFPIGQTTVNCAIADPEAQPINCNFLVTINDVEAPVIASCAPPQTAPAGPLCQAPVPDFTGNVVATDCTALTVTQSPLAGTPVGLGSTTVTLTVKDAANNVATCSTTFTVDAVADLSVQVTSSPDPVTVGQPLSYTVTINNAGPCPATGVSVNHVLSAGQVLVSVTDLGTATARACPTPGPSAWWHGEGNAMDSAGANHGTINGGVTFSAQAVGQGFSFDGLTGYLSAPDAPALRPAGLTIEGWIKIGDPNGLHVLLAKPQGGGLADSYSLWVESGVLFAAISDNAGSGPLLSYPNVPTSSTFLVADIVDFPSLANKLKTPADPVSTYLNSQLSAGTLTLLTAYGGGPDAALLHALVSDFNVIIQSGPIHTPARFAGVTLAPETQYLLARNPTGTDLVRLNRLLIRDAYPAEIQSNLFPELNARYHVAYTFNPATQQQALYVNGALVDSSFVSKTITYAGRPLLIGAGENAGSPDYFYQGEIDELSIYDRALCGIEVQAIHGAGTNGKCAAPGPVLLGNLSSGGSQFFTVVAVPTNCPTASLQATASGAETDPVLADNTATATAAVNEIAAGQLRLSIRRVSVNNSLVEVSWPITCAPYLLQTTGDLTSCPEVILCPDIFWTPASVPVSVLQGRYSTVVPADDPQRFFRLKGQ